MLQDATRRWPSSKATKQTRTRRCKTSVQMRDVSNLLWMLLEDEGDEGCKYPRPPCAPGQIENASPITNTFLTFSTNILCPCANTPEDSYGASSDFGLWAKTRQSHGVGGHRGRFPFNKNHRFKFSEFSLVEWNASDRFLEL